MSDKTRQYNCTDHRVVDGDTIELNLTLLEYKFPMRKTVRKSESHTLDLGFSFYLEWDWWSGARLSTIQKLRLIGVDAPEMQYIAQRKAAGVVMDAVHDFLAIAPIHEWKVFSVKRGVFRDRFVGDIVIKGNKITQWLLDKGLVVPSTGARHDWSEAELAQIERKAELAASLAE